MLTFYIFTLLRILLLSTSMIEYPPVMLHNILSYPVDYIFVADSM